MDEDRAETKADVGRIGNKLPISQQDKAVAELHEVISILTDRLNPVLTPVPESDHESPDKEVPSQSPVGEQISDNTRKIHRASGKLRTVMERLEC